MAENNKDHRKVVFCYCVLGYIFGFIVDYVYPYASYGMQPDIHGFSHGLKKCPPDTFLPSLRSGRPFESRSAPKEIAARRRHFFWRRVRDSNPRFLSESLVFKTSSLNRSDNSPCRYTIAFLERKVKGRENTHLLPKLGLLFKGKRLYLFYR